mgnify:CR=1 FL=1
MKHLSLVSFTPAGALSHTGRLSVYQHAPLGVSYVGICCGATWRMSCVYGIYPHCSRYHQWLCARVHCRCLSTAVWQGLQQQSGAHSEPYHCWVGAVVGSILEVWLAGELY